MIIQSICKILLYKIIKRQKNRKNKIIVANVGCDIFGVKS